MLRQVWCGVAVMSMVGIALMVGCGGDKSRRSGEEKALGEPLSVRAGESERAGGEQGEAKPQQPQPIPAPPDVAAPPDHAQRTASGLATRIIEPGDGTRSPGATSVVRVHYTGWTTDGQMFDSSVVRGEPLSFPLDKVIAGWREGVMLMTPGETRRLWIPESLAYQGRPGAPQGMLVFDVTLLAIESDN